MQFRDSLTRQRHQRVIGGEQREGILILEED